MVRKINDNFYVIKVALPKSPLRDLNSYVIKTPERNLLIDTCFDTRECLECLETGIHELDLDMNRTDILTTHAHADHYGLINKITRPGCAAYVGEADKTLVEVALSGRHNWKTVYEVFRQEGLPDEITPAIRMPILTEDADPVRPVALTPLEDGDYLHVGPVELRCIHVPGHSPGQICLYDERDKIMILGDHVLFDITPNIAPWGSLTNALKSFLDSLKKISAYEVDTPLPAHREVSCTMAERIQQLQDHHERRLEEVERIVREHPGINGYETAKIMDWKIKARSWEEFPTPQKWFATGEAMAHLYYLQQDNIIQRVFEDGMVHYYWVR